MPKIPGINHLRTHFITIPRHNPVNAITMGGIVKDAGLSIA
jgi:hypothetical protein